MVKYSRNLNNYFFKLNLLILLFIFSPNIYNQSLTAEQVYKKVAGAVVVILAYDSDNKLSSQGSGVVISDKGYVVTNYHILAGNNRLEIIHNKESIPFVDIIGIDVDRDILILKIEDKKFSSVKIRDSRSLSVGQRVYAIGSPLGFENSISEGIISGLRIYGEMNMKYIQITASISPGSSGGAVVNDKGELIGVSCSTIKGGQNINFAIPIDDILSVKINSYLKNNTYKNFELFSKGWDEYKKGNYKEAIKYYSVYIQKNPNDERAYLNRGVAENDLNEYFSAILDYNKAIEINADEEFAYNNRGLAKANLDDNKGAIQDYNKAIEIDQNFETAYFNRGNAKFYLEDYRGAIMDYNKAVELDSINISAYLNLGAAKFNIGDKNGACLDWSKAGELGSNSAYDLIKENCNN